MEKDVVLKTFRGINQIHMTNRRDFIKQTGAIALSGALLSQHAAWASVFKQKFPAPGLQLFTFFNVIDDDVNGTLKKIADLGYKNIESAFSKKGGYYGMKAKEFASTLKNLGMSWRSHHVLGAPFKMPPGAKPPVGADGKPLVIPQMKTLRDNYQELVDEAAEGGVEFLVCANTPIATMEEIKSSLDVLNKTAEAATKAGLQFAYHNHEWEFKQIDGTSAYEIFMKDSDPKKLKFELDIAWAVKGGADPVALFEKSPGRFPLWHVKDLEADLKTIKPVGEGTIDYKKYFAKADTAGLKYFFVEHDMPADPIASITASIKNLRSITGK
jgi:sugar phosphate isomerase/epimerase